MLHALIMAGGGGTRFWPRSRAARPKQFLAFGGERTLLQSAVARADSLASIANIWIGTAGKYRDECIAQAPHVLPEHVIGEPVGRDTAPCIGLAAALIEAVDPGAIMLVTPADHVITPDAEFRRAVNAAVAAVEQNENALVTMGIVPTFAATGYGYIRRGKEVGKFGGISIYQVEQFREKPDAKTAEEFVAEGGYYWNAGIFVWRAKKLLDELRHNKPALAAGIERIAAAWQTSHRDEELAHVYPTLERISIDYAVMEPAKTAMVLEAPFRWDDVGSWRALERMLPPDKAGNTVQAQHIGINTKNCVIVGDSARLIATVGVSDLIIVHDDDAILIADRKDEAALKQLVERLGKEGLEKYL